MATGVADARSSDGTRFTAPSRGEDRPLQAGDRARSPRVPSDAKQPRWPSPSASSTVCSGSDVRGLSASPVFPSETLLQLSLVAADTDRLLRIG